MNTKASKYLTPKGKEIIEAAKAFVKEHPARSGYKYKKKHIEHIFFQNHLNFVIHNT